MSRRTGDVIVLFTTSAAERELIRRRAAVEGLSVGEYCRRALNALALEEDDDAELIDERPMGRPRIGEAQSVPTPKA